MQVKVLVIEKLILDLDFIVDRQMCLCNIDLKLGNEMRELILEVLEKLKDLRKN